MPNITKRIFHILAQFITTDKTEIMLRIKPIAVREASFTGFSIFRSDGHFVQRSGTILATLVEGYPRNISVKLL